MCITNYLKSMKNSFLNLFYPQKNNLPLKLVMLDLETTGTDPKTTEILEIGAVLVELHEGVMTPKQNFHVYIQTDTKANPENPFVMKFQKNLYDHCNNLPKTENLEKAKKEFKNFLDESFPNQNPSKLDTLPQFTGQNFSVFDSQYLLHNGLLQASTHNEKNEIKASYNYRSLEIQSYSIVLAQALGYKSATDFMNYAASLDTETELPEGNSHTALYDCYKQIKSFNGLMKILKIRHIDPMHRKAS